MPESTAALRFEGVGHAYGNNRVVDDVHLDVQPGELVAILGASGSGKTTLLRAAAGFVHPTVGSVVVAGRNVAVDGQCLVPAEDRGVGLMFQDYALFSHMTVAENVGYGIPHVASQGERISELLSMVGLSGQAGRRPAQLSGGQQQRVALARALAPRPGLLLLDEPFANLDGLLRHEVASQVVRTLAQEGVGGLLVTHDKGEALALADRIAVLGPSPGGAARVLQVGTPVEVYQQPADKHVVSMTGLATFLEGSAIGKMARCNGEDVVLRKEADGPVTMAVRPEEVTFRPREDGRYQVVAHRYRGRTWELEVSGPLGSLFVDWNSGDVPRVGDRGQVQILNAWPL